MEKIDHETENNMEDTIENITLPKDYDIEFQKWMVNNGYAIKTIKDYHHNILEMVYGKKDKDGKRSIGLKLLGCKKDINIKIIKDFLNSKNYSVPKRSAVKLFILFLEDFYGIIVGNFRYPRIKKSTKALEVISKKNFDLISNSFDSFLKMFSRVMYYGGLRVSEVARINTEDFNWIDWVENKEDYGELKITKSKRNKERIVPITSKLMQEVYDFADKHENSSLKKGILFNYQYVKSKGQLVDYYSYIKRSMRRKKVSEEKAKRMYNEKVVRLFQRKLSEVSEEVLGKHVKTHMLRASRATHLDEKGMPPSSIQYLLGHDNLATTSRYIINNPGKLKKQMQKADLEDD